MKNKIRAWFRETSFHYWLTVILSILDLSEVKDDIVSNGRGLLVGFLAALFSYIYRGEYIDIENISYYALVFFGYSLVFYIGERIIYVPFKMYKEERTKVLQDSWRDIEIKSFPFGSDSGFSAGIELISHKNIVDLMFMRNNNTIEVLYKYQNGTETAFQNREEHMYLPLLNMIDNSLFLPTERIRNVNDKDNSFKASVIPLVKCNENGAWIVSNDGNNPSNISIEQGTKCRLIINMTASRNLMGSMDCGITCDLFYDKDEKGNQFVTVEVVKRNPPYEL
ncbi:MAG: hypothetical protein IPP66_02525 [Anaerolineales bacterium]|nr:hypothetical protein [Anaerolineales bacterium]